MAALKFFISIIFIAILSLSCATTSPITQGASDLFSSANDNLKKQRFEEAKYEFKQFVKSFPDSDLADDALFRLGYISCVQEKYTDASGYYSALVQDYPKSEWIFDAGVWKKLLDSWISANDELESVKKKLNAPKVETNQPKPSPPAEGVDLLKEELNRLKEDNRKLRELIESME